MNGTGSFTGGFFNDGDDCIPTLDPEDCIFSSGASLPVMVGGTSIDVGTAAGGIGVALCYDPASAFAPTQEHQRALRIKVNQLLRERRGY